MKVVFDCRYTRIGRHDGISRYTAGIVTAFAKLHPVTMLISDERQLELLPDLPWIMSTGPTNMREPWVARQVNGAEPDVVFSPMQTMGSAGRRYKLILTLHDLIYYTNRTPPRDLSWAIRLGWRVYHLSWLPVRLLLKGADAIVTGSYTTREELLQAKVTDRPITVIRSAVDQGLVAARNRPRAKTLVYMGSFMPYKNVEAIARALHALPGYQAHLMSRVSDSARERLSAMAPPGALVFRNGVSDEEYRETLAQATALVTASRQEGFGIPLVEAMSLGTPIVVTDIPVFHEIGGEAAAYFPADDSDALARAVIELDRDGEWERRSALARELATQFTWDISARTLLDLAKSLVHDDQPADAPA